MATWAGWESELLNAAGFDTSAGNVQFLHDWGDHTNSACVNNPIDLSRVMRGSSDCHDLPGSRTAQKYVSHAQAANAFAGQVASGDFPILLAAFKSGDAYTQSRLGAVMIDLDKWGSHSFVLWLEGQFGISPGGGGLGTVSTAAPKAHNGWADLRHSVNHNMPAALRASQRNTRAALRSLSRARKVRL